MAQPRTKRLIIRLSSLGDVILATSSLGALGSGENHWVVSREYSELLKGHPRLSRIWEFDRKRDGSLIQWLGLCGALWNEGFTEVLDLHCTWRSRLARMYFAARSRLSARQLSWRTISKERLKLNGLFLAKALWPRRWLPTPLVVRSARLAGGSGNERPDLSHLLSLPGELPSGLEQWLSSHPGFICVMPSSKWDGKKWGVRGFFEVISSSGLPAVVLGNEGDRESHLLSKTLEQAGLSHFDGVGKLSFKQLARVLAGSEGYLGNDTGLAHLAEAVGTEVVTVFGPTIPEMGFGPWRPGSRAVGVGLWCKPCGKDGRTCYRWGDRYACQRQLLPERVAKELEALIGGST